MKHILFIIAVVLVLTSCKSRNTTPITETYGDTERTYLVTLTVNGKSHEFVELSYNSGLGIAHWPECKYCKNSLNNK